ncbi:MAG: 2-C-methyl-D-erythritol 2,4-cyclodiphosphate synthase [Sulfobacillus benefaciens]|uniref:2-C-methyl-D-erythritol 2,4-cyclodiphosphate synthase n=1 Tax=Sulfobacillus benefaciens TaxID=453960 RepID=A0A2T2XGE9_9FIRM|nr:MAG: 2-C-methyl-D-erythritol 2,4-cyclodiphosphate synthase [Sulfobacillus benefaciens]
MRQPRIGQGIDVHPLVAGRDLVLGGVTIPHRFGLEGDTDGDVLTHAIMDGILGALALGDLGQYFRRGQPEVDGARSITLLQHVCDLMKEKRYVIGNVDATVVAEMPKLAPYRQQMQDILARALEVEPSQVSIKATTTDHLGMLGREEGIMAQAVVLLWSLI